VPEKRTRKEEKNLIVINSNNNKSIKYGKEGEKMLKQIKELKSLRAQKKIVKEKNRRMREKKFLSFYHKNGKEG
jgi:hypothetical protein